MSENIKKFNDFAIQSALFKGRDDWYFCFLKSERVAHVLVVLSERAPATSYASFDKLCRLAADLPRSIAHFAAGGIRLDVVLADAFTLMSILRLAGTNNLIEKENVRVLIEECEGLVRRLGGASSSSFMVTSEDFAIGHIEAQKRPMSLMVGDGALANMSDAAGEQLYKGHTKNVSEEQKNRLSQILTLVQKKRRVSIKDISLVVRNVSEKTIQRELGVLIERGLVRRVGERRWSLYEPIQ